MTSVDQAFVPLTDYTLLDENVPVETLASFCDQADSIGVKSVCVAPSSVEFVVERLRQSRVLVCSVVSFPNGLDTVTVKTNQIAHLIQQGVDEIDMVINYHQFILGDDSLIRDELSTLANSCSESKGASGNKVVSKVIVESGELTISQVERITEMCMIAGVDFIKTSTGKVKIGAELDKVEVMRSTILKHQSALKIKASGGIRTMEQINTLLPLVDRFGIGYTTVDSLIGSEQLPTSSNY